jgi:AraC-like DNA-binding protein
MAAELGRYRERLETSPLRRDVLSTYTSPVPPGGAPFVLHVLPDCFVDILWGPQGHLRVAGPDRRYRTVALPAGEIVALRFRRGASGPLLGVAASDLADRRVPLADLWGPQAERLAEQLDAAPSTQVVRGILRAALLPRLADAPPRDELVHAALALLQRAPTTRIAQLCEAFDVSERQLRRRFQTAVGYGPKRLQRIFRLQRFLRLGRQSEGRRGIAQLANLAGFVDQAHLTNECVELFGFTPTAVLARGCAATAPAAQPTMSVSYKTGIANGQ